MHGRSVVVREKEEFKHALDQGAEEIEVRGELAERLTKAVQLRNAPKWRLWLLVGVAAAMPMTGGASGVGVAALAALSGLEIVAIGAVLLLGVALVLQILKDYDVVGFDLKYGDVEASLHLRRRMSS